MTVARTPIREYETIYVLKPELEDAKIVELEERLRGVVEQAGGKSIKIHNWGKKKLSFEKDKVQKGIYVHHLYLGAPTLVAEYERVLKYMDEALLYQTIRLTDDVDPETRPSEPDVLHLPVRDGGRRDRDGDDRPHRASSRHSDDDDHDDGRADDDADEHDERSAMEVSADEPHTESKEPADDDSERDEMPEEETD